MLQLLLVPAMLLTQMLCVCAHARVQPPERAEHACCHTEAAHDRDASDTPSHDAHCPHCSTDASAKFIADRYTADVMLAIPQLLATPLPDIAPAPTPTSAQPIPVVPPPPLDRLLVTCTRLN